VACNLLGAFVTSSPDRIRGCRSERGNAHREPRRCPGRPRLPRGR
jgi:hypothetical protein